MRASVMTGPHLSISDLRWRASSSGVEPTAVVAIRLSRSHEGIFAHHRGDVGADLGDDLGRRF